MGDTQIIFELDIAVPAHPMDITLAPCILFDTFFSGLYENLLILRDAKYMIPKVTL